MAGFIRAQATFGGETVHRFELGPAASGKISDNILKLKLDIGHYFTEFLSTHNIAVEEGVDVLEEVVSDDEPVEKTGQKAGKGKKRKAAL